jgi:hypothetical protein
MERELGRTIALDEVRPDLLAALASVFDVELATGRTVSA